ncbi:MAG: LemA family protein [Muribaculaceae bacterium]|jgi:LemA protein|nr:LemA family protein [Muribaculaceae bacterium]
MKKGCIGLIVLAIIAIALFGWVKSTYNGLVGSQESVETAWAQVENVYQRRADLIPNLVETVKGYAKHEQETLEGVIQARANATKVTIDPANMTPEDLQKYQSAQGEITNALSRLIAVSESYPDLKANQNFLELQNQLEGTENRIAVERNKFNEVAREYNTKRRTFPTNIIAAIFNFGDKPYFQAQEGADKAPKVDFGTSEGK